MKKIALLLAVLLVASLFAGCGAKQEETVTLNVLNWGDYIDETMLAQFPAGVPEHQNQVFHRRQQRRDAHQAVRAGFDLRYLLPVGLHHRR
jgi:hypothetical protein